MFSQSAGSTIISEVIFFLKTLSIVNFKRALRFGSRICSLLQVSYGSLRKSYSQSKGSTRLLVLFTEDGSTARNLSKLKLWTKSKERNLLHSLLPIWLQDEVLKYKYRCPCWRNDIL